MVLARVRPVDRQRIIDEYLNESGANYLQPHEFLQWLSVRPRHPAHGIFFGISDTDAAMAYRISLVRKWVSGLRIVVADRVSPLSQSVTVTVTEQEVTLPAMFSPVGDRRFGGGYHKTDPDNSDNLQELCRQAATDFARLEERWGGLARLQGIDLSAINEIIARFDAAGNVAIAAE